MIGDFIKKRTHKHKKKKKKKGSELNSEEYIDLTEMVEEEESQAEAETYIKIAEIHRYEDVRDVTDEVYNGNILVIDTEDIAGNEEALRRVHNELKAIAGDVSGDIAAIGQHYVAITPAGIAIDRNKIKPF